MRQLFKNGGYIEYLGKRLSIAKGDLGYRFEIHGFSLEEICYDAGVNLLSLYNYDCNEIHMKIYDLIYGLLNAYTVNIQWNKHDNILSNGCWVSDAEDLFSLFNDENHRAIIEDMYIGDTVLEPTSPEPVRYEEHTASDNQSFFTRKKRSRKRISFSTD